MAQVSWLGLTNGSCFTRSLHLSLEPSKQWPYHDEGTESSVICTVTIILTIFHLHISAKVRKKQVK